MTLGNDNGTDGQTDRVRRNIRPPPREEGRIIIITVRYATAPTGRGALSNDARLTSVAYIGPKTRTERPRNTQTGIGVSQVTRLQHHFQGQKVIIINKIVWRPTTGRTDVPTPRALSNDAV